MRRIKISSRHFTWLTFLFFFSLMLTYLLKKLIKKNRIHIFALTTFLLTVRKKCKQSQSQSTLFKEPEKLTRACNQWHVLTTRLELILHYNNKFFLVVKKYFLGVIDYKMIQTRKTWIQVVIYLWQVAKNIISLERWHKLNKHTFWRKVSANSI